MDHEQGDKPQISDIEDGAHWQKHQTWFDFISRNRNSGNKGLFIVDAVVADDVFQTYYREKFSTVCTSKFIVQDNMSLKAHGKASIDLTKTWIVHQAATRKSRNQEKEGDITSHPFFTSPSHLAETTRRSMCVPPVAKHTLLNRNLF
ncbi:hypothetical protein AVEN_39549-1 [Araneus ventricosus]|uniref:Uncharacterized protein n=1 Tax=Araneus ventricosus TaxID=182803 RepID=A0A4Y2LJP4_ARAVE|nr:hypothetical protein AVEN_39549-1 [Araneus ventricosus]